VNINHLDILRVTHTHTDCLDVVELYEDQMSQFFPFKWPHIYLANKEFATDMGSKFHLYNEMEPYPTRWLKFLKAINSEYIFLDHEDMFLYEQCDLASLTSVIGAFVENDGDYLRLIKSDQSNYILVEGCQDLYKLKNSSKWIFSIQPSIWKRQALVDVLEKNSEVDVWQLEVKSQKVVKKLNIQSYFSHRNGAKRGLHHYDSEIYPYVATAIGKGQWNLTEYGEKLFPLFIKFKLDPSARGWF
jgi:hypothetical protein